MNKIRDDELEVIAAGFTLTVDLNDDADPFAEDPVADPKASFKTCPVPKNCPRPAAEEDSGGGISDLG